MCKRRLIETFKNPKTDATALMNLRKSLDCLRTLPNINLRYMWKEKEIFNGDLSVIFGLFEELHKYYDNAYNINGYPYFG